MSYKIIGITIICILAGHNFILQVILLSYYKEKHTIFENAEKWKKISPQLNFNIYLIFFIE